MTDRDDLLPDPAARPSPPFAAFGREPPGAWLFWALAAGWTFLIGLAFGWNRAHIQDTVQDLAAVAARSSFEKDLLYRQWAAMHGGVYVPITDRTPPSPYLAHLPERDIVTPSGRRLTLMNPAYMTRQVHELGKELYSHRGHITSLKPIRPGNAPDAWERNALDAFEHGVAERSSVESIEDEPYLRFMRPMRTASSCLGCHAAQGYKEGEIRGGISVRVPMKDYAAIVQPHQREEVLAHVVLWGLGLVSLGVGSQQIQRRRRERDRAQTALREGEARFRAIFEDLPVAVWEEDFSGVKARFDELRRSGVTDFRAYFEENPGEVASLAAKVRVVEINQSSVRVLGAESKEEVVRELPRYFTARSLEVFKAELMALAEGRTRFSSEIFHLTVDGRPVVFDLTLSVPHGHEDTLARVLVSFVDITERKRAEEALRESEARLNKAQEIAHVGSWELDLLANRLSWSDEVYRICGLSPQGSPPTYESFLDAVHPDDRLAVGGAYATSVREGKDDYEIEHRIVRAATGEIRHVREKCQHIRDASGKIVRSVGMVHDITESRRAEEALRDRNRYIEAILENAPIGFAVNTIHDGLGAFVSSKFEEIYGVPRGTIHTVEEYFEAVYLDPVFREEIRARIMADMATGDAARMRWEDLPITTAAGEEKFVTAINIPLLEQNLMVSTVQDVTARHRAEEARQRQADELRARNEELTRFNRAATDRELRMIELKREINELCHKAGQPPRYRTQGAEPLAKGV